MAGRWHAQLMIAKTEAVGRNRRAEVIERVVDAVAASRAGSILAILIVGLVAFLPAVNAIPPLDRDEPQFILGTKVILETGDIATTGLDGGLGLAQPIGVNWLQLASVALVGDGTDSAVWVYRLPSIIGAIAVLLLTWWMGLAFGRPRAALLAAVLVAATPLLVAEAHLAKADAIFLAAIVLAHGALARLWMKKNDAPDYWLGLIFWTGLGFGILVKGLVALFVIGLTLVTISVFERSYAWLRRLAPVPGLAWLCVIVVPWVIIAGLGGSFADGALPERIATQQAYEVPPGTYAILFYPLFGPAGVFVALAIPGLLDHIRRPVFLFTIASAVPFWLAVELFPTKLPYYILPAYPALALIGATAIDEGQIRVSGWVSTYFSLNLAVWPVVIGSGAVLLFFLAEGKLPYTAIPIFAAAIVVGAIAFHWLYRSKSIIGSAVLSLLSALLLYIGVYGVVIADLTAIQISSRLVETAKAAVSCEKPEMVATGFFEPSLVFYAGNDIKQTSPEEAADFLAEGGCRTVFVEARRQSTFNQRAEDIGLELNVHDVVQGFNIGNWRSVQLRVFAAEGALK